MPRTLFSWVGDHWQGLSKHALIILLLALIFFVAGGGVSHKEKWRINDVQIRGTQAVSRDGVYATIQELLRGNYYFVYARDNSILFPKSEIEQKLRERFVRLENVNAERINDHTIIVKVTERKPYALWCEEDADKRGIDAERTRKDNQTADISQCYFVDKVGYVLDHAPIFSDGVYVKYFGAIEGQSEGDPVGHRVGRERFGFAQTFEEGIRGKIGDARSVNILKDNEYELLIMKSEKYPMLASVTIRFNNSGPAEMLVDKLSSALKVQFPNGAVQKKKLQYIDMRFGNKIFFGFEN